MRGEQIYLRPLTIIDAELYKKSTENEEIMHMTGTRQKFSLLQIEKYIESIMKDDSREDYAICSNKTNEMIGELTIMDINSENNSAGFRIAMNSIKYVGCGFGSEAIKLVIRHVFNTLKLNRLQLEVYSHNSRGIKAYEKTGFVKEGILREALFYNGEYSDEIIMSIIRKDFENQ